MSRRVRRSIAGRFRCHFEG